MGWRRAVWLSLALWCQATCARAQVSPEETELRARAATLETYFAALQRPTRAYVGTWVAVMGALAVGQTSLALVEDARPERAALWGGAAMSTLGAAVVAFVPAPGRYAARRYAALPDGSLDELRAKVRQGEVWLRGEARSVERARAWWAHAVGAALSTGILLGLGLGYDDNWFRAVTSSVGAMAVIEARIWTRSTRGQRYLSRYGDDPRSPAVALAPSLLQGGGGVTLTLRL